MLIAQARGSATDVISRVVGNRLSEALGQPIVVEARPGAGNRPCAESIQPEPTLTADAVIR